jgi:hypothetical protein
MAELGAEGWVFDAAGYVGYGGSRLRAVHGTSRLRCILVYPIF